MVVVGGEERTDRRCLPYLPSLPSGERSSGTPAPLGYRLPLASCAKTPGIPPTLVTIGQTLSWWKTWLTPAQKDERQKIIGDIFIYPIWLRIVFAVMFDKQFSHKHFTRHVSCDKIDVLSVIGSAGWLWVNQDWWCVVFVPVPVLGTGRTLSRREQVSVFNGLL